MAILKEGSKIKDKEIATKEDLEKVNSQYEELKNSIGNLQDEDIPQELKDKNIIEMLKINFSYVDNGKKILETAIIDKGGNVSKTNNNVNFKDLENGIRNIENGDYSINDTFTNEDIEQIQQKKY